MADVAPEQTDVNSQVADAVSSSADATVDVSTTPPAENVGETRPENKVPQTRFNEVIQERNSEREAREREKQRPQLPAPSPDQVDEPERSKLPDVSEPVAPRVWFQRHVVRSLCKKSLEGLERSS